MQFVVSGENKKKEFPVVAPGVYEAEVVRARIDPVDQEFKARNSWMTWDYEVNFAFKLDNKDVSGGQWFWARAGLMPSLASDDRAVQWIAAILGEATLPQGFSIDEANISGLVGEKVRLRLDSKYNDNKQVYENRVADVMPTLSDQGGLTMPPQATQTAPPAFQPPQVAPPLTAPPAFQTPTAPVAPSPLDEPF